MRLVVENTEKTENEPDFGRGLFVCAKPGHEFVGAGRAGAAIGVLSTQFFAMLFLIPGLGFFVIRNQLGASNLVAGVLAGVMLIAVLVLGVGVLLKINKVNRKGTTGAYFKNETDSRYRVRVVIPEKRQDSAVVKWARLTVESGIGDDDQMSEDELEMMRGGFEPMIIHPWFGIKRDRRYWWTFGVMSLVVGGGFLYGMTFLFGSWTSLFQAFSFLGYATMGLAMVGGVVAAELMWPVYVRLVPGQLDVFRYGFLGSGKPTVESFDLHKVGVCVDFGGYIISLEPERPVGEPLPALVMGKRWPNGQAFPEDFKPMYFTVVAVPNRREFAQRLVQAARTDEPTPAVSMDRLGE